MNEIIGGVLIAIGLLFDLLGCVGLVRLPDIYTRLQAATKCVTLGTCLILIGSAVVTAVDPMGVKALICMAFVLVTSPTAAHAIARGAYKAGVPLDKSSVVDLYRQVNPETPETSEDEH
jgi:multicomponent Na+:H+ antiporter subunit G